MKIIWGAGGKRACDLFAAISLTVLLSPVLLVMGALVRLKLGSPILFSQERLGKDANPFRMYKFRSMTDARDRTGALLPDAERLTPFSRWLRSSSLDELPQLANVLRCEMSLVGPRPTLLAYRDQLLERYPRRFEVLPGMTSLAAVRGRNGLTWDQKFGYDVEYVDTFGPSTDLAIVLETLRVVLLRKGITMTGVATSTRYDNDGNDHGRG